MAYEPCRECVQTQEGLTTTVKYCAMHTQQFGKTENVWPSQLTEHRPMVYVEAPKFTMHMDMYSRKGGSPKKPI